MAITINRGRNNNSKNLMWSWLMLIILVILALILLRAPIWAVLTQGGSYGIYVNAAIIVVTVLGFISLFRHTLHLRKEEAAFDSFYKERALSNSFPDLNAGTYIADRLISFKEIHKQPAAAIDSSALAQVAVAREYARLGFARFIQNILILLGVFGTILALSLALLGASDDLLMVDGSAVGDIIGNMSVAFSTTLTSIACYLVFSYMHSRVVRSQTLVLSRLEEISATDIAPFFTTTNEKVVLEIDQVLGQTQAILKEVNAQLENANTRMNEVDALISLLSASGANMDRRMDILTSLLRQGFRLPENDNQE